MKRLSKLRQFRKDVDPVNYMTGEHRQNLLAIEESFRILETKNFAESNIVSFSTTAGSYELVDGLSLEINLSGGPVLISLMECVDGGITSATNCKIKLVRTTLNSVATDLSVRPIVGNASKQSTSFVFFDVVSKGIHTYKIYIESSNATLSNVKLFIMEMK
jgi:hypothetical protein